MSEDTSGLGIVHTHPLRIVTDDQGEAVVITADSTPFGLWLRRAVVDNYGDEVMSASGDQLPPS